MQRLKLLLIALFVVGFAVVQAKAQPTNLLKNPGFEQSLTDWDVSRRNQRSWSVIVNESRSGKGLFNRPLELKNTDGDPVAFFAAISQTIPLQATDLRFSGTIFAKTELKPTYQGRIGLQIIYKDQNNRDMAVYQDVIGGQNNWRKLHVEAPRPADRNTPNRGVLKPTTVTYQLLVFFPKDDKIDNLAKVFFDDAVFVKGVLPGYQTKLLNGRFDNGLNDWTESFGLPGKARAVPSNTTQPISPPFLAAKSIDTNSKLKTGYFSELSQDIYADQNGSIYPKGKFVNVKAKVRAQFNPKKRSVAGLTLQFISRTGKVLDSVATNTGGSTPYQDLYVSARTPAQTKLIRVIASVFSEPGSESAGGQAFFDNIVYSNKPLSGFPKLSKRLGNANFENGLDDAWDEPFPGSSEIQLKPITRNQKSAIAAKLKVTDVVKRQNFFGSLEQTLKVDRSKNKITKAGVFAKANLKNNSVGTFELRFYNDSGAEIISSRRTVQVFGQSSWLDLSFTDISIPTGADTIKFICSIWAAKGSSAFNNYVVFDDAILRY